MYSFFLLICLLSFDLCLHAQCSFPQIVPPSAPTSTIEEIMQTLSNLKPIIPQENFPSFINSFSIYRPRNKAIKEIIKTNDYLKFVKHRYDRFLLEFNDQKTDSDTIPRLIHQIWLGSCPPQKVLLSLESWKKHNPEYTIKLWQDQDLIDFCWGSERSKLCFYEAKNYAEKSDILRFEILLQFGGIYSDTDIICMNSFEHVVNTKIDSFAGLEQSSNGGEAYPLIGSAIVGAKPGSLVIKKTLEYSKTQQEAPTSPQYLRSGPGPLSMACYEILEDQSEDLLIFPTSYFFPLPGHYRHVSKEDVVRFIYPETLTIHLWEGSWLSL